MAGAGAEWSLPAVLVVVTAAAPHRDMLVWTSLRRTYAEVQDRTRRLAAFLRVRGLGLQRERAELDRWACGQSRVALVPSNCPAYVEAMIGAYRARAVPYNVNHHYNPREVGALIERVGADAVVYHRRLAPLLAAARLAEAVLVDVDDGSGVAPLPGSVAFEDAVAGATGGEVAALPAPSPDDLYLVCTGGTTGAPTAVLWRLGALVVTDATRADLVAGARARLSAFKVPTCWVVTTSAADVPVTATGKVDKAALQALLQAREGSPA